MRVKKNKPRYPKEHKLIEEYYNRALKQLNNSNNQVGHNVIYNMPLDLYDMSINILYNSNEEFVNNKLRTLIKKVDAIISKPETEDIESNLIDDYGSNF